MWIRRKLAPVLLPVLLVLLAVKPTHPAGLGGKCSRRCLGFSMPWVTFRGFLREEGAAPSAIQCRSAPPSLVRLMACSTARRFSIPVTLTDMGRGAEVRCCPSCFNKVDQNPKAKFCSSCGSRLGIQGSDAVVHWKPSQAKRRQFTNGDVGRSSCGICSVFSMLAMIGKIDKESSEAQALVQEMEPLVKKRACDVAGSCCRYMSIGPASFCPVSLRDHLVGRSECGSSGSEAIISKVEGLFPDVIGATVRIGETLPIPECDLLEWMAEWMRDGAALAVTFNRQNGIWVYGEMPDCWHAQGVFGVDLMERTVGLTNPIKEVTEEEFIRMLPSEDVIHLRGNEVLLHCQGMSDEDIRDIAWPNDRWTDLDVAGQVLMLRQMFPGDEWPAARDTIVTIPYAGTGEGVGPCFRMFAMRDSNAGKRIAVAVESGSS